MGKQDTPGPINTYIDFDFRHTHVSLRGKDGKNIFAVSEGEIKTGRANAGSEDTKFISETAEFFLAGILDGIADGESVCTFRIGLQN